MRIYENGIYRDATPEEIAEVALFLAVRKVDFLNGVNLPVDGGITCHTGQPHY